MQSIISKGKNVNEAINLGLSLLATTIKDVNIEIVQHESKGFLRIGSKEAIVKLVKHGPEPVQAVKEPTFSDQFDLLENVISSIPDEKINSMNLTLEDPVVKEFNVTSELLAGKAWVENGKIYCQSSPKHFPMVTIPAGMKLLKNNLLVKEKTAIVTENETFALIVENEEVETKWKVTLDHQKLKAVLAVEPGFNIKRSIPTIEADYHIHLYVEEIKEVQNHLSYEAIVSKLESLRVIQGFNHNEIIRAMGTDVPDTFEIATGIEAKEGNDGWVEVIVDLETHIGPKESEDGSVDYREIKSIPAVRSGEVVAIVHDPIPGQCGTTVTNDPIPAKQTFPVSLKLGKGLSLVNDQIVSTEPGRPQIEKRGRNVKISIMQKLTHRGDVDLASGNIRFMGDVEVLGHICEGMLVEAEGDITVRKEVNRATLTASGAMVSYGNIVGSEISAGKSNMIIAELGHLLGTLHQNTERIIVVINQLIQSPAFKNGDFTRGGLQPLIRILLEKKFKIFPPLAKRYVDVVREADVYLDDEWKQVSIGLTQLFLSLSPEQPSLNKISALSRKMKELYELSQTPVEPDSYIVIPSASNSHLYCSGDVRVTGKGCVNTKIHAGGKLEIRGIIRGGEVYARSGAVIHEAGAEIGTPTIIAVPYDQKITIHKAMEGTTIKIGKVKHIFKETRQQVTAFLDLNERIIFV